MLLIIYPLLLMLAGLCLGYKKDDIYLLAILAFIQALLQFIYFFRAKLQASQFFALDSFASVADKIILIVIILVIMTKGLTLESFVYGRVMAVVITFFVMYVFILKLYGWIRPGWSFGWMKKILAYSWPFALITILYSMNEKIDQVMLERIKDAQEAGLYAGAYRWLDAFMMYLWTIMPIFFAKFSFNIKDKMENEKIFNSGQVICAVPLIFVACFVLFYGDKLFFQFTNSTREQIFVMTTTVKILFVSMLMNGFFSIYSTLLNSTGYVKSMSLIVIVSIIINVVLNFIFIPVYGAIAAASATVVSTIFLSLGAFLLVHLNKLVRIPYEILGRLLVILILSLVLFYFLPLLGLNWYLVSILTLLMITAAGFLLGLKKYLF
jgi:O-antigen/teichoic acid export membrane protein